MASSSGISDEDSNNIVPNLELDHNQDFSGSAAAAGPPEPLEQEIGENSLRPLVDLEADAGIAEARSRDTRCRPSSSSSRSNNTITNNNNNVVMISDGLTLTVDVDVEAQDIENALSPNTTAKINYEETYQGPHKWRKYLRHVPSTKRRKSLRQQQQTSQDSNTSNNTASNSNEDDNADDNYTSTVESDDVDDSEM